MGRWVGTVCRSWMLKIPRIISQRRYFHQHTKQSLTLTIEHLSRKWWPTCRGFSSYGQNDHRETFMVTVNPWFWKSLTDMDKLLSLHEVLGPLKTDVFLEFLILFSLIYGCHGLHNYCGFASFLNSGLCEVNWNQLRVWAGLKLLEFFFAFWGISFWFIVFKEFSSLLILVIDSLWFIIQVYWLMVFNFWLLVFWFDFLSCFHLVSIWLFTIWK